MASLLERLSDSYDMVLLDSPPLLPVTDAVVLSKMAGGAVVIVGADRIHRPQLQQSLDSLETAGAHLFGIVMNKIARRDAAAYGYSGYASYGPKIRSASGQPNYGPKLRPAPGQPKRRWDGDDTLVSRQVSQNGHNTAADQVR
jgi:Mrp family chromosome partitioning ATPase